MKCGEKNRKFQFLSTIKILIEKGYDINSLSFNIGEPETSLAKLIVDFKKKCTEYQATPIEDPSWFKSGKAPENYAMRKVNNPWLFAGILVAEIYAKDTQPFEREYEDYLKETKMPLDRPLSYEEFMHYSYQLDVPAKTDNLRPFIEAREAQKQKDQDMRNQQLSGLSQENIETNEGNKLK